MARIAPVLRVILLLVCAIPMIVPSMVLGTSVFYLAAPLGWIGHPAILVGCYALLSLPYATLVLTTALARFDWQLPKAAATLGASPRVALLTIVLPLILPSIAGAFIFSFFVGFDDVNVALFLANPYDRPLPIVMLDDIRDQINPRTASVAVIFFLAAVLLCLVQAVARRVHSYFALRRFELKNDAQLTSAVEVEA
jgi:ABC-type spermidine/putrescine transport system permease subunit II